MTVTRRRLAAGGFVEPEHGLRLRWGLLCDSVDKLSCRGLRQQSYRAVVTAARSGVVVHDSGAVRESSPFCTLDVGPSLAP